MRERLLCVIRLGRRTVVALALVSAALVAAAGAVEDDGRERDPGSAADVVAIDEQGDPGVAPPPTTAADPVQPAPRSVSIAMGGDLLWHNTVWQSAEADARRLGSGRRFDFGPMLAGVRPWFRAADIAVCHEEVPFALPGQALSSFPVFAAPPQVAPFLREFGFDACTTASNHAVDGGWAGLEHTADLLARNGIAHVGTFRSAAERRRPVILTTEQGVRVGLVAGTYSLNGFPMPEGRPWAVSMWDVDNLLAQARAARRAGADVVVVHLHGGTEYDHLPDVDQTAIVDALTRSPDVDLVLGDHAHVVQPITRIHRTWVVLGMGNLVAQSEATRPSAYQGITVRFTLTEQPGGRFAVTRAEYQPVTWGLFSSATPIRVRPATGATRRQIRADVHALGHTGGLIER